MQCKHINELEEFSDYEYCVSNTGIISREINSRPLKPGMNNGYLNIRLIANDKKKSIAVSRLVAKLFVDNPDNKNIVNHIDGNKLNNHYTNLEWTTQKENIRHANENNLVGYHPKPIIQLDLDGNQLKIFDSIQDAAKHINLTPDAIIKVLRKKNKTAGSYKWKYANEIDNITYVDDDEKDECKTLKDFDRYQIFPDARVYSIRTKRFLKPVINTKGYSYVTLCKKGEKKKNCYIHTIVAKYFIPNPDDKNVVNHIDANKSNNHVDNLEWVTQSENMKHAFQLKKSKISDTKLLRKLESGGGENSSE